jgi:hypothetical protein
VVDAVLSFVQANGAAIALLALLAASALAIPIGSWVSDPFASLSREAPPGEPSPWDAAHEAFIRDRWI